MPRHFHPHGPAYTSYLRNTGQIPNKKVQDSELTQEQQKARMLQKRSLWELVLHKLD